MLFRFAIGHQQNVRIIVIYTSFLKNWLHCENNTIWWKVGWLLTGTTSSDKQPTTWLKKTKASLGRWQQKNRTNRGWNSTCINNLKASLGRWLERSLNTITFPLKKKIAASNDRPAEIPETLLKIANSKLPCFLARRPRSRQTCNASEFGLIYLSQISEDEKFHVLVICVIGWHQSKLFTLNHVFLHYEDQGFPAQDRIVGEEMAVSLNHPAAKALERLWGIIQTKPIYNRSIKSEVTQGVSQWKILAGDVKAHGARVGSGDHPILLHIAHPSRFQF